MVGRSRLCDIGLWLKEEKDGGRNLGKEELVAVESSKVEENNDERELRGGMHVETIEVTREEKEDMGLDEENSGIEERATIEEDQLFGARAGYPTSRRPIDFRTELTTDSWEVVSEWFNNSGITVRSSARRQMESGDPDAA